jgi:ferric reductase like protein
MQVYHQCASYIMFTLVLIHIFPFVVYHVRVGDMSRQWNSSVFYWSGTISLIAQTWLTFAALQPFRRRCYEFFKASHLLAAIIFMIFLFIHCDFRLSSW